MTGREIIRRLEAEGWTLKAIKGSHHQMIKDGRKVPVPVHGNRDIPTGTIAAIEKQTGVTIR